MGMGHGECIARVLVIFDRRRGKAAADDFRGIADDHEGLGVEFVDDFLDFGYFCQFDDGVDDALVLHGIGPLAVDIGGAMTDVAHENLSDGCRAVGNDENAFSLFQAEDDFIRNEGGDIDGDEGQDGSFQGEHVSRCRQDNQVENHCDRAHFQGIVFFDDSADDVEAAAVAVIFVNDAKADARQDAAGNG